MSHCRTSSSRQTAAAFGAMLCTAITLITQPAAAKDEAGACMPHIAAQEKDGGIPEGLLKSIGFAESGRTVDGRRVAWPWTVNAQGQGHYFASKEEAIAFVEDLQAQGVSVIDVGCMQVNLHYHPRAFASLDEAFEPASNVAYAAKFLRWLEDETDDWSMAAQYYHSRTPRLARAYAARLTLNAFGKVINAAGPIVPLTKAEREALAVEIPDRLKASEELVARLRTARLKTQLDKAGRGAAEMPLWAEAEMAAAVEPAAGSEAVANTAPKQPKTILRRGKPD
jgi:hypothetical protein